MASARLSLMECKAGPRPAVWLARPGFATPVPSASPSAGPSSVPTRPIPAPVAPGEQAAPLRATPATGATPDARDAHCTGCCGPRCSCRAAVAPGSAVCGCCVGAAVPTVTFGVLRAPTTTGGDRACVLGALMRFSSISSSSASPKSSSSTLLSGKSQLQVHMHKCAYGGEWVT